MVMLLRDASWENPANLRLVLMVLGGSDVLPIKRAIWNLVKFVFREENGREEAIYG